MIISFSIIIFFALVLISIIFYYCISTFNIWKKLKVPYVRPVPLFGNYLNVALGIDHPVDIYKNIYKELAGHKYGGYFQMRTPYLMIRDPEMVNNILIRDFSHFCNRGIYSDFTSNPLTNNLFFMHNPQWKIMRNILSSAFTSSKLKQMHDQIKECSEKMMKTIDNQLKNNSNEIDVRDVMRKFTINVIVSCAFGININSVRDDAFVFHKYAYVLFRPSLISFIRELCLMTSTKILKILRFPNFPKEATDIFHSVFHETLAYRQNNNIVKNDIAQYLIQARHELVLNSDLTPEEKFSESQIIANAFAMFTGAIEGVASTLSFCLHELALKKHIQDKVRKEIKLKKLEYNGVINNDFLMNLKYLDMVIAETLRKYPTVYAIFREANETYHVPNDSLIIERGQKLMIPVHSLHYDPKYFSDPEVFDPERFSFEEKAKRPNIVYFPFGEGPRMCIGKRFAEIEMKLALVNILSKFEVEPCDNTEIPIKFSKLSTILVTPKNGFVWLKFNSLSN